LDDKGKPLNINLIELYFINQKMVNRRRHFIFFFNFCLLSLFTFSQSDGGIASGSQTFCDSINSGFVSISGYNGNVVTWQQSTDGGANWTNNGNTFTSQSYFNIKQTTCYRAIVQSGAFPPDTSTIACITVFLKSKGGNITGDGNFCGTTGNTNLALNNYLGNVLFWQSSTNGGANWTLITNTSPILSISNVTVNTLYRAIVQNGVTCPSDTSSNGSINILSASIGGSLSVSQPSLVCYGNNSTTITLSGQNGNVSNWAVSINNGTNWNPISNITSTFIAQNLTQNSIFAAVIQNGTCAKDTSSKIYINVSNPLTVFAGNDTTITQSDTITLNGLGSGGTASWSPANTVFTPTSFTTFASPINTTTYILTVTDVNSCSLSDSVIITVNPLKFEGNIANIITPNGDGVNDNWFIEKIKYYPNNEVSIFNIYGQPVYQKKNYNNEWDATYNGTPLPDGTYYYVLKLLDSDLIFKGSIDIIRGK
jgi:gliding motility-associated-like protein